MSPEEVLDALEETLREMIDEVRLGRERVHPDPEGRHKIHLSEEHE